MGATPIQTPFRRILEEGFNQGNLVVVDEVFAAGYQAHISLYGAPNGPQGFKWLIAMLRTAFPDLHCNEAEEIFAGDRFAGHWVMHGTQQGMFLGNLPTGRRIEAQGTVFARLENGRIVEDWFLLDLIEILRQVGAVPPLIWKGR